MKKILNVGIDIGSTTVKMVVVDKKNKVLYNGIPYCDIMP